MKAIAVANASDFAEKAAAAKEARGDVVGAGDAAQVRLVESKAP